MNVKLDYIARGPRFGTDQGGPASGLKQEAFFTTGHGCSATRTQALENVAGAWFSMCKAPKTL